MNVNVNFDVFSTVLGNQCYVFAYACIYIYMYL